MSRSSRGFVFLGILAVAAATSFLASCTLVNEPLVSIARKKTGQCVKECRDVFHEQHLECVATLQREQRRCQQLPSDTGREACIRGAVEEFLSCSNQAREHRWECLNGCHSQGTGGGR
jgi:hypothetical protein